ncbi:hypothetical protein GCM10027299_21880 [Larkinella ripae]
MSYREKIVQTRTTTTESNSGGQIEDSPATVLSTVADVQILRDPRRLEALSLEFGKAIIITIRNRRGLDAKAGDRFEYNGKKYTAQGGWVPTKNEKEVTLLAIEQ